MTEQGKIKIEIERANNAVQHWCTVPLAELPFACKWNGIAVLRLIQRMTA